MREQQDHHLCAIKSRQSEKEKVDPFRGIVFCVGQTSLDWALIFCYCFYSHNYQCWD